MQSSAEAPVTALFVDGLYFKGSSVDRYSGTTFYEIQRVIVSVRVAATELCKLDSGAQP